MKPFYSLNPLLKENELKMLMKTLNNLIPFVKNINLQTQYVIHTIIPTNYLVGGFILEYNISKDSLYMPS